MYTCWDIVRGWRHTESIPSIHEPLPNINDLPALDSSSIPDLTNYQNLIIGGPTWGWTLSDPLITYLSQTDLEYKNILAYWTCVNTSYNYEYDFKRLLSKKANYLDGLEIDTTLCNDIQKLDAKLNSLLRLQI